MFIVWVNQRKRKEEINPSKSSLRDPKPEREEHIFLMQLISSEKNSTTKINNFEGSEPEWLVPRGTSFFAFGRGKDFWEGERKITYWCMPTEVTISFFFISFSVFRFSSYLHSFFFFFLLFLVSISWFLSFQCYPLPRHHCCYCTQQGLLFIVPIVTGFYYFSP